MAKKNFVGIGFGPIQSALFLLEAFASGNFDRLVVAEVAPEVVSALRRSDGKYRINVAEPRRVRSHAVEGIEILNPGEPRDREQLVSAIASADEIATALPSVEFFGRGSPSPAKLLASGIERMLAAGETRPMVVYAAENHNHAAELLRDQVQSKLPPAKRKPLDAHVQFVNTVIGKMSGVVTDREEIEANRLEPLTGFGAQAVLVEQFNRILIEKIKLPGFQRGLNVFEEKEELLPFEEAKLYGHNGAHALMGYLAQARGMRFMSQVRDSSLLELVEHAFLAESGVPLCRRHAGGDPLFTDSGWQQYVLDLLQRMTNPFLQDRVDRVTRDPQRKLGWSDRLIGTMRMAIEYQVQPYNYALGAAGAVQVLLNEQAGCDIDTLLEKLWNDDDGPTEIRDAVVALIHDAFDKLGRL